VCCDVMRMGQTATEMLLAAGHRRIGFFCGSSERGDWNDRWMTGFRLALMMAGVADDNDCRLIVSNVPREEVGTEAAPYFASMDNPPTAYITPSARATAKFLLAMNRLGKPVQPDHFIMGGSEDEKNEFGLTDITLITEPIISMAERAAALMDALTGSSQPLVPARVVLPLKILTPHSPQRKSHF